MTQFEDADHSEKPTKRRILTAIYFLIDSCRQIGERKLASDLETVVRNHDDVGKQFEPERSTERAEKQSGLKKATNAGV